MHYALRREDGKFWNAELHQWGTQEAATHYETHHEVHLTWRKLRYHEGGKVTVEHILGHPFPIDTLRPFDLVEVLSRVNKTGKVSAIVQRITTTGKVVVRKRSIRKKGRGSRDGWGPETTVGAHDVIDHSFPEEVRMNSEISVRMPGEAGNHYDCILVSGSQVVHDISFTDGSVTFAIHAGQMNTSLRILRNSAVEHNERDNRSIVVSPEDSWKTAWVLGLSERDARRVATWVQWQVFTKRGK